MTIDGYQAELELINKAIHAILDGAQEYRIGSRSVRRADLSTLLAERGRLEGIIAKFYGGTTLARIGRR